MGSIRDSLLIQGKSFFHEGTKKSTVVLLLSIVLIVTWRYFCSPGMYTTVIACAFGVTTNSLYAATYSFLTAFLLFGLVPVLVISLYFKESLQDYGFHLGDWRFGGGTLALLAPLFILLSYLSSNNPEFLAEYPINKDACLSAESFLMHSFLYLLYYIGYEVLMRGFIQFGLRGVFGDWNAILIQTTVSTLFHIGKPAGEIYASILGGLLWGFIVFRTRSLVYVLLMHWILGVSLDFFICWGR